MITTLLTFVLVIRFPTAYCGETTIKFQPRYRLFNDSSVNTKSKTVIRGPQGTRSISSDQNAKGIEYGIGRNMNSNEHYNLSGPENTGVQMETRVYLPNQTNPIVLPPGSTIQPLPNGGYITTPILKGNGSIDTQTERTEKSTPNVQILQR